MASAQPVEPKDPLGKEIFSDIKSYTDVGESVPQDVRQELQNARKTGSFDPSIRPMLRNTRKAVRQYR